MDDRMVDPVELHQQQIAMLMVKIRQLEQEIVDLKIALEDATRRKWRNGW